MANETKPAATQPQAAAKPAASNSQAAAQPAPQTAKPEPKLPGIRVLKEGSDKSTQNVQTLTESRNVTKVQK